MAQLARRLKSKEPYGGVAMFAAGGAHSRAMNRKQC
jgi:hypothetical protein